MVNRDYNDPAYKKFRSTVRRRDGFKCQWPNCSQYSPRQLIVHHIRPYANHIHLRTDPNNGITLCRTHHKLTIGHESNFLPLFLNIVARNKQRKKR